MANHRIKRSTMPEKLTINVLLATGQNMAYVYDLPATVEEAVKFVREIIQPFVKAFAHNSEEPTSLPYDTTGQLTTFFNPAWVIGIQTKPLQPGQFDEMLRRAAEIEKEATEKASRKVGYR